MSSRHVWVLQQHHSSLFTSGKNSPSKVADIPLTSFRFFAMFNIVPSWIYGTEIWPQEIRAKGYSFTIFGWACGCGLTTFTTPILLDRLGWGTYLLYGSLNVVAMPIVYLFYPEVANRTLEEVNLLFTSDSLLVRKNMVEYDRRVGEAGGNVAVAARRLLDEVDGHSPDASSPEKGYVEEGVSETVKSTA